MRQRVHMSARPSALDTLIGAAGHLLPATNGRHHFGLAAWTCPLIKRRLQAGSALSLVTHLLAAMLRIFTIHGPRTLQTANVLSLLVHGILERGTTDYLAAMTPTIFQGGASLMTKHRREAHPCRLARHDGLPDGTRIVGAHGSALDISLRRSTATLNTAREQTRGTRSFVTVLITLV